MEGRLEPRISKDRATINGRHFGNVEVVYPLSRTQPFTVDFLAECRYRTREFVEQLGGILINILRHKLSVAGVTLDGCSFQKKGLTWRDRDSIQAHCDEFKQFILVPFNCLSHRRCNASVSHLTKSCFRALRLREADQPPDSADLAP
jgi:hypothetical protein